MEISILSGVVRPAGTTHSCRRITTGSDEDVERWVKTVKQDGQSMDIAQKLLLLLTPWRKLRTSDRGSVE